MAKIKLYRVVCNIYDDYGKIFQLTLNDVMGRYDVEPVITKWGVDYDLEKVVKRFVYSGVKVRYDLEPVFVKTYEGYEIPPFHADKPEKVSTHHWLNRIHSDLYRTMNNDDFLELTKGYGNNYISQIKGGEK